MPKKIYVGNLSFSTTEESVRDILSDYGAVHSIAWITDRDTGRFRGFCFAEMEASAADQAIAALDGKEFDGRNLRVTAAQPSGGGAPSGGARGGGNRRGGFPDSGGDRRW